MGGNCEERLDRVRQVREQFLRRFPNGTVFTLSEHISSSDRYLKSARKTFPIKPVLDGQKKGTMSYDQLNDSCLDWATGFRAVLVILPEFDELYRADPGYFYQVIGHFLAQQLSFRDKRVLGFVMTLAKRTEIDFAKIPILIGGDWSPSASDIEIRYVGA